MPRGQNRIDVPPGTRFPGSKLTVVREAEPTAKKTRQFTCACDCGGEITARLENLRHGGTTSCGCVRRDTTAAFNSETKRTHGLKKHELYQTWGNVKHRCANDPDYVGRGIILFPSWREDVARFIADVEAEIGPRPSDRYPSGRAGYSLDRIDNDGNYEPGNIRWATGREQTANQRRRPKYADRQPFVSLPTGLPPVVPTPRELKKHELYSVWRMLIYRCESPTSPDFPNWGGRGVRVCARWHEFALFLEDVPARPEGFVQGPVRRRSLYTLDRIENSRGYEPGNVRWATQAQQRTNQRPRLRNRDLA